MINQSAVYTHTDAVDGYTCKKKGIAEGRVHWSEKRCLSFLIENVAWHVTLFIYVTRKPKYCVSTCMAPFGIVLRISLCGCHDSQNLVMHLGYTLPRHSTPPQHVCEASQLAIASCNCAGELDVIRYICYKYHVFHRWISTPSSTSHSESLVTVQYEQCSLCILLLSWNYRTNPSNQASHMMFSSIWAHPL